MLDFEVSGVCRINLFENNPISESEENIKHKLRGQHVNRIAPHMQHAN